MCLAKFGVKSLCFFTVFVVRSSFTHVYVNDVRNEPVFIVLLGILQLISHGGIFLLHTLAHMFSVDLSFI